VIIACSIAVGGCASIGDSPRAPYATPDAVVRNQPGTAAAPFRMIERWDWSSAYLPPPGAPLAEGALERGALGLYETGRFAIAPGDCAGCGASELVRWWFADELVAVPRQGASGASGDAPVSPPPAVWIGAPQRVFSARLSADASTLHVGSESMRFAVTPRITTNASYLDGTSARFFAERPLLVRGAVADEGGSPVFIARSVFPEDQRIDLTATAEPLRPNELLGTLVEAQAGADVGAAQRVLFARPDSGGWADRPVLTLVLTGAQGDDDGARGGHLAIATGTLGARGEWHDWLATNFYPLVEGNAKGIIPASLPMDTYLYDLNSGQLMYRPGYMLVAVLRDARSAEAAQHALQQTMLRLYCGDIEFDRARFNSTAMSIDPLRELGWRIPAAGPTSRVAGIITAPFAALFRWNLGIGRSVYAMFATERTRLLPRVAFEVAGHDLLHLAALGRAGDGDLTPFERMLAEDIEALLFVRLPQVPSARRFGTYPVPSLLAYGAGLLADPADFESAPEAEPRQFSERLRAFCPAP
jgi:hypothetical protein